MEVKVADFSSAAHLNKQTNRTNLVCGSVETMAPEMLA
jgi:serine/threonine protein kinase